LWFRDGSDFRSQASVVMGLPFSGGEFAILSRGGIFRFWQPGENWSLEQVSASSESVSWVEVLAVKRRRYWRGTASPRETASQNIMECIGGRGRRGPTTPHSKMRRSSSASLCALPHAYAVKRKVLFVGLGVRSKMLLGHGRIAFFCLSGSVAIEPRSRLPRPQTFLLDFVFLVSCAPTLVGILVVLSSRTESGPRLRWTGGLSSHPVPASADRRFVPREQLGSFLLQFSKWVKQSGWGGSSA